MSVLESSRQKTFVCLRGKLALKFSFKDFNHKHILCLARGRISTNVNMMVFTCQLKVLLLA